MNDVVFAGFDWDRGGTGVNALSTVWPWEISSIC